ncbi:MAG: hypothetical protein LBT42_05480 [Tannerella sp.]|jgi:hypothetical protein|nr:hypothetical protein [Tannerella sp.]
MKDEYTFVTLDNDMVTLGDAVFVDVDYNADFVQIDDSYDFGGDSSDFIIMDDSDMMNCVDVDIDTYSSDISEADVSILL